MTPARSRARTLEMLNRSGHGQQGGALLPELTAWAGPLRCWHCPHREAALAAEEETYGPALRHRRVPRDRDQPSPGGDLRDAAPTGAGEIRPALLYGATTIGSNRTGGGAADPSTPGPESDGAPDDAGGEGVMTALAVALLALLALGGWMLALALLAMP